MSIDSRDGVDGLPVEVMTTMVIVVHRVKGMPVSLLTASDLCRLIDFVQGCRGCCSHGA